MQTHHSAKRPSRRAILDALSGLGPMAKGSLSLVRKKCTKKGCRACAEGNGHPAWIFMCRCGGRNKCMHVRLSDVDAVRAAVENARAVEEALAEAGVAFIESLRTERPR